MKPANNTTVLIIEDNAEDADLIRIAIRRAGIENPLHTLHSPGEALDYLQGRGKFTNRQHFPFPEMIILDHKMPGDGWEIIKWVRSQPELHRLPLIVLSGSDNPSHEKKSCDLGANAYHQKPHDFVELIGLLKRIAEFWLRGSKPPLST